MKSVRFGVGSGKVVFGSKSVRFGVGSGWHHKHALGLFPLAVKGLIKPLSGLMVFLHIFSPFFHIFQLFSDLEGLEQPWA